MSSGGRTVISVVIPALNEEASIGRAVASATTAGADEVIVADGGSTDATCEIAGEHGGCVVNCSRGRGVQQNAGAARATGDVLLFLHADNWLASSAIEQVRSLLSDPSVHGGAFQQRIEAQGVLYRLLEAGNALRVRCLGLPYGDQGIFLRRSAFEELGGMPAVPLMEDLMLMQQFRRRWRPILLPGPIHISPRRWQKHGVIRQTLRNWGLLASYALGRSPAQLAARYTRHDSD